MLSSLSSDYFDRKRSELFDMHSNVLRKHDRERKKAEQVTKIV